MNSKTLGFTVPSLINSSVHFMNPYFTVIPGLIQTSNLEVVGYSDSDYAGCKDTRKSTFGYLFLLADGAISWKSGKQSVIATSTMEAEFIACFEATVQSFWLRNFFNGLSIIGTIAKQMRIYCDNAAAVFFSKNDRYSKGAKHMDLKYLSIKEEVQKSKSSNSAHWHP